MFWSKTNHLTVNNPVVKKACWKDKRVELIIRLLVLTAVFSFELFQVLLRRVFICQINIPFFRLVLAFCFFPDGIQLSPPYLVAEFPLLCGAPAYALNVLFWYGKMAELCNAACWWPVELMEPDLKPLMLTMLLLVYASCCGWFPFEK